MNDDRKKIKRDYIEETKEEGRNKQPKVTQFETNEANFFLAGAIFLCWGRWWFGLVVVICLAGREFSDVIKSAVCACLMRGRERSKLKTIYKATREGKKGNVIRANYEILSVCSRPDTYFQINFPMFLFSLSILFQKVSS